MKVSCVRVGTELLIGKKHDNIITNLAKEFLSIGAVLESYITTPNNADKIFNALNYSDSKIVFVIGENTTSKNYEIKKIISQKLNLELQVNEQAKVLVDKYYENLKKSPPTSCEKEYLLPENAKIFNQNLSELQGFMTHSSGKIIFFLPDNEAVIKHCFNNYIKEILKSLSDISYDTQVIKVFGISEKDIYNNLGDLVKNEHKILFITFPNGLDTTLLIRYNKNLEREVFNSFLQKVYERLNKFMYATEDVSLQQHLIDLLSINRKTISIVETVSGGEISSMILRESGTNYNQMANENINELVGNNVENNTCIKSAIVLPNIIKLEKFLDVNPNVLNAHGEFSVEATYEMAATMLEQSGATHVLCTCAESITDNYEEQKTVFIAVGDEDGIHVYKNIFSGEKRELIKSISQTSLFYLIKNIKQKGLLFSEIIV